MALCISRHVGESLFIGSAKVMVSGYERGRIYLRIEAPKCVTIMRQELLSPSEQEQLEADRQREQREYEEDAKELRF